MFFRYTLLAWAWTCVVLVLCLMPGDQMPEDPIQNADKIYHAGAFALMGFLFAYGFSKQGSFPLWKKYAWYIASIISIFIGGAIEVMQHYFVYNRHGDWMDWLFDGLGALLGVIILSAMFRYNLIRKK